MAVVGQVVEDISVLLTVGQHHGETVGVQLIDGTFEEQGLAHVWLLVGGIGIEENAVATSEIGQEVFTLFGNGEQQCSDAWRVGGDRGTALCRHQLQVGVDGSSLLFLRQWHVP